MQCCPARKLAPQNTFHESPPCCAPGKCHGHFIEVNGPDNLAITPESSRALWQTVKNAVREHGLLPILVDTPAAERCMGIADAQTSGTIPDHDNIGVKRVAFHLHGIPPNDVTQHFKLAAGNRGTFIEFFDSREKAIHVAAGLTPHAGRCGVVLTATRASDSAASILF